jgi:hypothetical protein
VIGLVAILPASIVPVTIVIGGTNGAGAAPMALIGFGVAVALGVAALVLGIKRLSRDQLVSSL